MFERGKLLVDGNVDFLAVPHLGVLAKIKLDDVDLDYFAPIAARYRVQLKSGVLAAAGDVEYGPKMKAVHIEEASITNAKVDYVQVKAAEGEARQAAKTAATTADQVGNRQDMQFRVDRLRLTGDFGFVNQAATPSYRVVINKTDLRLENLSNHFTDGPAKIRLTGLFMGSGETAVTGTFRSDVDGPDFDLNVRIVDTDLRSMNDILRAYGKFDVVAGYFSLESELAVKNKAINGYIKPFFRNLDVYDKRQDKEKGAFRKLYEGLVGGVAKLLENFPRDEVATKAEIKGRIDNPQTSTLQVIVRLVQNAFFQAILPGFDREVGSRGRK